MNKLEILDGLIEGIFGDVFIQKCEAFSHVTWFT